MRESTPTRVKQRAGALVAVTMLAAACISASGRQQPKPPAADATASATGNATAHAGHTGHGDDRHGDHGGWDSIDTATDVVVTTRAGDTGVEVFASSAVHGWAPQHIVTIDPGGTGEQEWMANQCITGTGRFAVVVIGPSNTSNPAVLSAGGAAYAVELETGAVWPIVGGVSLYYDNPGCGADDRAAILGYTEDDQAATRVYVADLVKQQVDVAFDGDTQINSPVPTKAGLVATNDADVVRVTGGIARSIAHTDGRPFSLRPRADGDVDLLVHHDGRSEMDIMRVGNNGAQRIGSGTSGRTKLYGGRKGRNVVVAADRLDDRSGLTEAVPGASVTLGASLDGGVVVSGIAGKADDQLIGQLNSGRNGAPAGQMRAPEPHGAAAVTEVPSADPEVVKRHGRSANGDLSRAGNTTTPKCAVPRNDATRQVLQPTPDQVYWAARQVSAGNLTAAAGFTRPANYLGNGLPAYSPSTDFPLPALAGNAGKMIPPELAAGVFAQESALRQAARFALPGVAGNPLISNYFGDDLANPLSRIDYLLADCGYGVAQLTTWMAVTTSYQSPWNADKQVKVALDYAENVAAGFWALAGKWNDVFNAGLTVNSANSDDPTSWYFALWAYNTGLWPSNQTKYTVTNGPAPDGNLPHGLGWTNNPRNSVYPPDRLPFLRTTWLDSKTPSRWPYQERVLGFVENPLFKYTTWGCIGGATAGGCLKYEPPNVNMFCVPATNQCDPNYAPGTSTGYCTRADRLCWWYAPVTGSWNTTTLKGSLITANAYGVVAVPSPAPIAFSAEPPWDNPYPPNCVRDTTGSQGDPPATAIIVDNIPDKKTIRSGCDNTSWNPQGTFSVTYGKNSSNVEIGKIDWHQLGTGWGGHVWFTHNRASSTDTSHINVGTWTPPTLTGTYDVLVHLPDNGASTENARYQVFASASATADVVPVNQHGEKPLDRHRTRWVKLGTYSLSAGARVVLDNVTGEADSKGDVAYDAVAFVPTSTGCAAAPGTDTDGDRLPDATEIAIGSSTTSSDTDGDGLPDAWEADPSLPGAGIYLPGRPCRVATRDELFGPYYVQASTTDKGEVIGTDARYNVPPDIRHKDTFVEVDWQSCNQDNSGCPSIGLGIGSQTLGHKFLDPAYHLPMRAAVQDVVTAFKSTTKVTNPDGFTGVTLHVLIDEKLEHRPTCDQAPSDVRGSNFGTPAQRRNRDLIAAKSLAFRYLWSGHSVAYPTASSCPTPSGSDLMYHRPLPDYDWTAYGDARLKGRDVLLSTALAWVCPSDLRFFDLLGSFATNTWSQGACTRSAQQVFNVADPPMTDGLYPNAVFRRSGQPNITWSYPVSRLLGMGEADGIRQVTGRALMRLLGVSLGVPVASVNNNPQQVPANRVRLAPEDYASWAGVSFAPPATDGTAVPAGTFAVPDETLQNADRDADGILEKNDNCPGVTNANQADSDRDSQGDSCDPDADGDGKWDQIADYGWGNSGANNIDTGPNDTDGDGTANSTDTDDDGDGRLDNVDNCPVAQNASQANADGDSMGDTCDLDDDNDGFPDGIERLSGSSTTNSSRTPEFIGQGASCTDGSDNDGDGTTDAADTGCADNDGDTMPNVADNCIDVANYGWRDSDGNGVGDSCDGVRIRGPIGPQPALWTPVLPGANPLGPGYVTVRWTTAQSGTFVVRLDGSCTTGMIVDQGTISSAVDEDDSDGPLLTSSAELNVAALAEGTHTVDACVTSGGVTRSDRGAFVIDRLGPAAPVAPDLDASTDSGASSTDNVTRTQVLKFSVAVPAGSGTQRIELFEDGRAAGRTNLWFSVGFGSLPSVVSVSTDAAPTVGTHTYTAVAVDGNGNRSPLGTGLTVTVTAT